MILDTFAVTRMGSVTGISPLALYVIIENCNINSGLMMCVIAKNLEYEYVHLLMQNVTMVKISLTKLFITDLKEYHNAMFK